MSTKESGISVKTITETAIMAALICVLGPLSVPVGPVPVSLAPFAIFLTVCVLGEKKGTAAVLIYLLLGLVGLPVFSGFTGGPQKLSGLNISAAWACGPAGVFRFYGGSAEAAWPDRRFPGRLYPGGADRGMGFRPFPQ